MKTPPPTAPTAPDDPNDEYDDSADAISKLLKRHGQLDERMKGTTPPGEISASEALQRQALDAHSKSMLVVEELATALREALRKLPDVIEAKVKDCQTVQSDRLDSTVAHAEQSIRDSMPVFNESGLRFLIHVYGLTTVALVMIGFLFLLSTHR